MDAAKFRIIFDYGIDGASSVDQATVSKVCVNYMDKSGDAAAEASIAAAVAAVWPAILASASAGGAAGDQVPADDVVGFLLDKEPGNSLCALMAGSNRTKIVSVPLRRCRAAAELRQRRTEMPLQCR